MSHWTFQDKLWRMDKALFFSVDNDRVDIPASTSIEATDMTIAVWCYFTDDTQRQTMYYHTGTSDWQMGFRGDQAGDPFSNSRQRATTYVNLIAPAANFAAYAQNRWLFHATIFNPSTGTATDNKLLLGHFNLLAAEPSSYTTQSAGSGTIGTTNAANQIGNQNINQTREFRGRIAWCGYWPRALTLGEIHTIQTQTMRGYPITVQGATLNMPLGRTTGPQLDISGSGNHGTPSGVTLNDGPLVEYVAYGLGSRA